MKTIQNRAARRDTIAMIWTMACEVASLAALIALGLMAYIGTP